MKTIRIKRGEIYKGVGYDKRFTPPKELPTLLPKKKTTPEKTGINVD